MKKNILEKDDGYNFGFKDGYTQALYEIHYNYQKTINSLFKKIAKEIELNLSKGASQ